MPLKDLTKSCTVFGALYKKGEQNMKWFESSKFCSQKCNAVINRDRLLFYARPGEHHAARGNHTPRPSRRGVKRPEISEKQRGAGNQNWNGGTSRAYRTGYGGSQHRAWRRAVFVRDSHTCQRCGKRGGYLTAHHIKSFAAFPDLRFEISNGVTLCEPCHATVDPFYRRLNSGRIAISQR